MKDLTWNQPWEWPIYDEPEDYPAGWPAFLAANQGKPIAVAHWDIAKAKKLGMWAEDQPNLAILLFNWYPACSAVPWWGRAFYVPFKTLEYRLRYTKTKVPCYLTLWTGKYHDPDKTTLTDETETTYWTSAFWNIWSWLSFKVLLWPRDTGRAYF